MFQFMRRFALVYNGPNFGGIVSFHWTEASAIAAKSVAKITTALMDATDIVDPKDLVIIPVEKKNRNKGTIGQGYIVYK